MKYSVDLFRHPAYIGTKRAHYVEADNDCDDDEDSVKVKKEEDNAKVKKEEGNAKIKTEKDNGDSNGNDYKYSPPARNVRRKLERRECGTCCNDVAVNRFPKEPHPGASWMHGRSVCFDCWQRHLDAEVEEKSWDAVKCSQCDQTLREPEIKKLALPGTYAAWQEKALQSYLQSEQDIYPCPAAGCKARGVVLPGNHILDCKSCGYRYCIDCKAPMHEEEVCSAYQKRLKDDVKREKRRKRQAEENNASEEVVDKTSKPCPNCSSRLDKYAGCDHVTCKRCSHEFCWCCSAPYQGAAGIWKAGNSAHKSTCPHHPGKLPNLAKPHAYDTDSDDNDSDDAEDGDEAGDEDRDED
ncbi:hypothetical protein BDY17DRAFT_141897 [Neohortaea acidophila]|uniref:RBR-type E3 ubiquitin transferase n=1 Tax=Neohortaea acidophila TaxID=245834 RepID=A0A6A6PSR0_9PEZI|nr:uncharacterized protein BDY17DRAFT_141897 [Neohortaea acidophila]KAF2483139.1 hypothetical protein BDY17DRAFT_141897 [Neohortaea acidophila]